MKNSLVGTFETIVIAHDPICPWCWVGLQHAKRLSAEFDVTFDWRAFDLYPPELAPPAPRPSTAPAATAAPQNTPPKKSRFDQFLDDENLRLPEPPVGGRRGFTRSHGALLGAEFAKEAGRFDAYNDRLYAAFWEQAADIADIGVLRQIAESAGLDADEFEAALREERHADRLFGFDDQAYSLGIRYVPTFVFGDSERLAEANYPDLARATERFLARLKK